MNHIYLNKDILVERLNKVWNPNHDKKISLTPFVLRICVVHRVRLALLNLKQRKIQAEWNEEYFTRDYKKGIAKILFKSITHVILLYSSQNLFQKVRREDK